MLDPEFFRLKSFKYMLHISVDLLMRPEDIFDKFKASLYCWINHSTLLNKRFLYFVERGGQTTSTLLFTSENKRKVESTSFDIIQQGSQGGK